MEIIVSIIAFSITTAVLLVAFKEMSQMKKPTYVGFKHKEYKWKPDIDYRKNPHLYEIGRGQQGVLICQPYKSELHPLWRFKTRH